MLVCTLVTFDSEVGSIPIRRIPEEPWAVDAIPEIIVLELNALIVWSFLSELSRESKFFKVCFISKFSLKDG